MRIEAPGIDSADRLADLWVELAADQRAYRSHLHADENRERVREAMLRHLVTGDLLAAYDPDIVGFVMFNLESGAYEQDVTRGVVQNIYVVPDKRGTGVGGALLDAAEAALAEQGADVVTLDVMAGNEDAQRFYRRHGYREHRVSVEKEL
jgi:ribosomal protein S18 acetylase RimI-like enzyme